MSDPTAITNQPRTTRIDLNADLGEGVGDDLALLGLVTSANIATGAHAGGGDVLVEVTRAAIERGVAVGAHPSYRDRAGFGRRSHLAALRAGTAARDEFVADLALQIWTVGDAAEAAGGALSHVKAHGALYNDAVIDPTAAEIVIDAVDVAADRLGRPLAIVTLPGGALAGLAGDRGHRVIAEGFVDRAYDATGRLVPRSIPGAVHHDLLVMLEQAIGLARGQVRAVDATLIGLSVQSLCVHGDTPGAVTAAQAVRTALTESGFALLAATAPDDSGGAEAETALLPPTQT